MAASLSTGFGLETTAMSSTRPSWAMRAVISTSPDTPAARIAKDGLVEDIAVVSSPNPVLSEAAIQAISGWEFDATLLNCMAVEAKIEIRTRFELTP